MSIHVTIYSFVVTLNVPVTYFYIAQFQGDNYINTVFQKVTNNIELRFHPPNKGRFNFTPARNFYISNSDTITASIFQSE
jgi:hypothetical protein